MRLMSRAAAAVLLSSTLVGGSVTEGFGQPGGVEGSTVEKPRPKDPDGSYEGGEVPPEDNAYDSVAVSFDVTADGGKIKHWLVMMNVVCVTYPVSVELISQPMPTMKVKKNGRFHEVFTHTYDGTGARIEVGGRLVGRTVKDGTLSYEVGVCARGDEPGKPIRWAGRRTGR
jgi:hypothetical protein